MNTRTIGLAVLAVAAAGAAVWYLYFQDEAPKPQAVVPAKPAVMAPKAESPTPAAPGTEAPKPPAAGGPSAEDVKAAQARVGELEKLVADLQRQVAMKDREIAEMEKKLAAKK